MRDKSYILAYLSELKYDTNLALDCAFEQKDGIPGAINWADLDCVEAKYCLDQNGNEYYEVTIEEAAPSNRDLYDFVSNELEKRGHNNIALIFDW